MSGPFVLTENGRVINCDHVAYITPNYRCGVKFPDGTQEAPSACVHFAVQHSQVVGEMKAYVSMDKDYPALLAAMGLKPVEGV